MIIDGDSADQTVTEKIELAMELIEGIENTFNDQFHWKGCELAKYMRDNMSRINNELEFTLKTIKGEQ